MRVRSAFLSLSVVGCTVLSLVPASTSVRSGEALAAPAPRSTGIFGYSGNPAHNNGDTCMRCHGGGVTPGVSLDGPTLVKAGETYDYSMMITGGQRQAAGVGISITDGLFTAGANNRTDGDGDELTHLVPEATDAFGRARFDFRWTAPAAAGTVTLYGAGNSVNLDSSTGGDESNTDVLSIVVVDCMVEMESFGSGTPGTGGMTPLLEGTDGLCTGGATLAIDRAVGGAFMLLWVSDAEAQIPFAGGHIFVDPSASLFLSLDLNLSGIAGTPGAGKLNLTLGDVSNFTGALVAQGLIVDPGAQKGIALTNGLRIDIGQ